MKLHTKTKTAMGILLGLAGASSTLADGGVRSGFYAGMSAGLSNLSGNIKSQSVISDPLLPPPQVDNYRFGLSSNSLGVSILGGYGYKWDCYWVAAELSYLFDRLESKNTATVGGAPESFVWKSRSNGAFGGALHLGYSPSCRNWVAYAILGLERRRFKMSFIDNNTAANINNAAQVSRSYNSLAFAPGIGLRVNLAGNVALRGEYKYAFHRSKSAEGSAVNVANATNDTITVRNSPGVQTVQVGVVYTF